MQESANIVQFPLRGVQELPAIQHVVFQIVLDDTEVVWSFGVGPASAGKAREHALGIVALLGPDYTLVEFNEEI